MKIYKSEIYENTYYQVELDSNGYGSLWEVNTYQEETMDKSIRCYLWNNFESFNGCEYDTEISLYEIGFLQDIFDHVRSV